MKVNFQELKKLLFLNISPKQTIIKNTFWLGFGNFASRLIKALLIIYVARALGSYGYGVFSYVVGLAAFFTTFQDIGITGTLTREGSKNPERLGSYISASLAIKIVLLFISLALVLFVTPLFLNIPEAVALLPIAGLLIVFDSLRDFNTGIIRAEEKMQVEALIAVFTNIAITALGILFIVLDVSSKSLLIGYTLGSLAGTLMSFWIFRHHFRNLLEKFDKKLIGPIIREAWPFALTGVFGSLMITVDTIMLGWLRGASDVGFYSAAQRPVQLLYLIPTFLAASVFPVLSRLAHADNDKFRAVFEKTLKSLFLLAIPIAIGGVLLSDQIIILLFGEPFRPAIISFALLITTVIIVFPSYVMTNSIFAYNSQSFFMKSVSVGFIINAILDYILIPHYGGPGSALATIVSQIIMNLFLWRKMKSINRFEIFHNLKKIIIATTFMGIGVFLLKTLGVPVIFNICIAVMLYLALLYFLREPLIDKSSISGILR